MKTRHSLYRGKVEVEYDVGRHTYHVDGKLVPGITSILRVMDKPALVQWAANMTAEHYKDALKPNVALDEVELVALHEEAKNAHRKRSGKKAAAGTVVHDFVERMAKGLDPDLPENPDAKRGALAFLDWKKQAKATFTESERLVYSRKHGYAGRLDFVAKVGHGKKRSVALCDLKTGSGIYDDHFYQLAAYALAYEEETGVQVQSLVIVNAQTDGQLFVEERDAKCPWYSDVFLKCLSLYKAIQEGRK